MREVKAKNVLLLWDIMSDKSEFMEIKTDPIPMRPRPEPSMLRPIRTNF